MKKLKPFLNITLFVLLSETGAVLYLCTQDALVKSVYPFRNISLLLALFWFCGCVLLFFLKGKLKNTLSRLFAVFSSVLSGILLLFAALFLLLLLHPDNRSFSASTTLFQQKNVMIVVPHQDDDINLAGGLIEQYTGAGSDVTVVFSTNGDRHGEAEIRAAEVVTVLTELGVKKENIYYLGFGDQWMPQSGSDAQIAHIYNSPDPDLLWTSLHGATETYSTAQIPCYQVLPYTRSSYVSSLQSIILEKQPDTIFAVDFDDHIDHKGTDLFFEEALCNVLTGNPDYHPTVYKGFCYGTGWLAADDYAGNLNLLSSVKPDHATWSAAAYGYSWDARVRFPMSRTNLNRFLVNTSIFDSMRLYRSQRAVAQASRVLNGDRVFFERRTDSLLYDATVSVAGVETNLLNDFKLKDFAAIEEVSGKNTGVVSLSGGMVSIDIKDAVTVNSVSLYDNPDPHENILEGYLVFSDGSQVPFGALNEDGTATVLSFPERQTNGIEIVITKTDGDRAGLAEIEAFYDVSIPQADSFLMAVDREDNFVYDYLLHENDTAALRIGRFPRREILSEEDILLTVDGKRASGKWENDELVIQCPKGSDCTVTVSDGDSETTFTVSHPAALEYAYLQILRFVEGVSLNFRALSFVVTDYIKAFLPA